MPDERVMIDRDAALELIRYTRHFSKREVSQRESPLCAWGLEAALRADFPDLVRTARAFAEMGSNRPCPTD